jgi:phosphatidylserine/phosphatidylglycerophosphate/cardiolipin synthase-like enzyme
MPVTKLLSIALLAAFVGCVPRSPIETLAPQLIEETWFEHRTPGTPELWDEVFAATQADGKHRVRMLSLGDEALSARINLIRSARKSIKIQTFIWTNDESGRLVMWELIKAVKQRGVHVRLIVDQMFSDQDVGVLAFLATLDERLEIQLFNPNANRLAPGTLRTLLNLAVGFKKVNMRMHNKVMVVDDRVAITGGRNIANEYFDRVIGLNFRDRDVIAVGEVAAEMSRSFDTFSKYDWSVDATELLDVKAVIANGEVPVFRTGTDFHLAGLFRDLDRRASDEDWVRRTFIATMTPVAVADLIVDRPRKNEAWNFAGGGRITSRLGKIVLAARESVLIQSPYLTLSPRAEDLFRELMERSPPVHVTVSTNSLAATDSWPTYGASYKQKRVLVDELGFRIWEFKPVSQNIHEVMEYGELLSRRPTAGEVEALGEDVFELDPRLKPYGGSSERRNRYTGTIPFLCLHQKSMVVDDDISFIGSYNLDPRSVNINTEVGLFVRDRDFAAIVRADIERDIDPDNSYRIAPRISPLGVGEVSALLLKVSEKLPVDLWPFRFATSFELEEGREPVEPGHESFEDNWRDVGSFPLLGALAKKTIYARLLKTVGSWVVFPLL